MPISTSSTRLRLQTRLRLLLILLPAVLVVSGCASSSVASLDGRAFRGRDVMMRVRMPRGAAVILLAIVASSPSEGSCACPRLARRLPAAAAALGSHARSAVAAGSFCVVELFVG